MKTLHFCTRIFQLLLCVLLASFLVSCQEEKSTDKQVRPNIILMFTDELQFSDIGAYGGEIPTPAIDKLALEGMKFTRAYTTASMCTPSRFSVLTGLYPGRCRAASFLVANPQSQPYNIAWNTWITADLQTLPSVLSENGYATGMAGKWHVGHLPDSIQLPKLEPDAQLDDPQVEEKLRSRQTAHEHQVKSDAGFDYAASVLWENFDNHPIKALQFHNFPWITRGAFDFLEEQKSGEKPFFLYLTPTAIHGPNHVADLDKDKTYTLEGRKPEVLQYNMDENKLKKELEVVAPQVAHRYAGISQIDHQLALVREKLHEIGKDQNTIIIFMSDHNIEPGKATSYEKGIQIPMIVYWPGITKGSESSAMVSSIDVFPTVLEAAGIGAKVAENCDGQSFMKVIEGIQATNRKYVYSENGYTRSISDGRYKYIALRYPNSLVQDMQENHLDHAPSYVERWPQAHSAIAIQSYPGYFDQNQLYDLEKDPYEQRNIYVEQPEIALTLKNALKDHLQKFVHPFDLTDIDYLESEAYQMKYAENKAWDLANIPWLSRDHGSINWPPK
jgi:arylsulfatase A-like enzyme